MISDDDRPQDEEATFIVSRESGATYHIQKTNKDSFVARRVEQNFFGQYYPTSPAYTWSKEFIIEKMERQFFGRLVTNK